MSGSLRRKAPQPSARPTARAEQQRVLEAAERSFAERGFENTKMQGIAADARVSLRSVYATARGKAELYRMIHETRASDLLARMEAVAAEWHSDPRRALTELIGVVATFLMEHPDFLRIQLRVAGAWALEDVERTLLADERREGEQLLERTFRRGIRKGIFHAEDPRLMVASLRAQQQVQLAAWIARRGRVSKRATIEAIQRQAVRLFCR